MAQYKRISGAIHNWAHSFMSIENYIDGEYFVGVLSDSAQRNSVKKVVINILDGSVSPKNILTEKVSSFISGAAWDFAKHIGKENVEPKMIQWARLVVIYNFDAGEGNTAGYSFSDPSSSPKAMHYDVKVLAMDDRGIEHIAELNEWWRN
mgnify:CR=1 FL=1